ncbi:MULTISPECIES: hypothetical protein [unclassified Azospirillum]|nr:MULTISPECIES: hypothetical protein [unclassified Azospirillum]
MPQIIVEIIAVQRGDDRVGDVRPVQPVSQRGCGLKCKSMDLI